MLFEKEALLTFLYSVAAEVSAGLAVDDGINLICNILTQLSELICFRALPRVLRAFYIPGA